VKKKQTAPAEPEKKQRVTLARSVSVEMEERKSVFIGHAAPVSSEEEARAFIEDKRREFHDATHNVYAYLLNGGAVARYSDDGEPQGTAGIPVLNVVKMSGATDLCVVVTRYFGGILLGAGGLVRAYGASARQAVEAAGLAVFEPWSVLRVTLSYSDYQKFQAAIPKLGASEDSSSFGEGVESVCAVLAAEEEKFRTSVAELTNGKAAVELLRTEERAREVSSGETKAAPL
jgi:uncharacterized YigZ family protein